MIVILGKGGHSQEVLDICREGGWDYIAQAGPEEDEKWMAQGGVAFALGSGTPAIRRRLVERYMAAGCNQWPAVVHRRAWVSGQSTIGKGVIVAPGAVIGAGAVVDDFALINFNATLGHGCKVGKFSVVLPGANLACDVEIGDETTIGAGAQILPGVKVGSRVTVGSSSMVTRGVPDGRSAVGVPARVMMMSEDQR